MSGNGQTERLREEIKAFMDSKGIGSFLVTFGDPDSKSWTWCCGSDDLFAISSGQIAVAEILDAQRGTPTEY